MRRFLALFLAFMVVSSFTFSLATAASRKAPTSKNGKPVSGWISKWDPYTGFGSFKNNSDVFGEISPVWYRVVSNGDLAKVGDSENRTLIDFAQSRNVRAKVVPTIQNDQNSQLTASIAGNESMKKYHIDQIISKVVQNGYDGIDIDYENLSTSAVDRENFNIFVKDLASALHSKGKILIVTLQPWADGHSVNFSYVASVSDKVRLMIYDEHIRKDDPGPISSIYFFDTKISTAIKNGVPKDRLVAGLPSYGRDWVLPIPSSIVPDKPRDLTFVDVLNLEKKYGVSPIWNDTAKAYSFNYFNGTHWHQVWFEDSASLGHKLDVVNKYQLREIAIWRLGKEDPGIWSVIRQKFQLA